MSNLILLNSKSNNPGIFAQTGPSTPVTGSTPGSIIGPGVGSLTFNANTLAVGDSFNYSASGSISSLSEPFSLVTYLGATQILSCGLTLPAGLSGNQWILDVKFTIQTIGGASKVNGSMQFYIFRSGVLIYTHNLSGTSLLDTTVNNTFDITAAYTTSSASNDFRSTTGVLKKTY